MNFQPQSGIAYSQANGFRSLDQINVPAAAAVPGTVLMNVSGVWSAYDGSHAAAGVVSEEIGTFANNWPVVTAAAPAGSVKALVYTRDAELIQSKLIGIDSAGITSLAALHLIVRSF